MVSTHSTSTACQCATPSSRLYGTCVQGGDDSSQKTEQVLHAESAAGQGPRIHGCRVHLRDALTALRPQPYCLTSQAKRKRAGGETADFSNKRLRHFSQKRTLGTHVAGDQDD
jgi:hypothetical protein